MCQNGRADVANLKSNRTVRKGSFRDGRNTEDYNELDTFLWSQGVRFSDKKERKKPA